MKKTLPILLLLSLAFAGCKKDKQPTPNHDTSTTKTDTTTTPPIVQATISAISPSKGGADTIVTITGTNFGTSATAVKVYFNGVAAAVQSVTATEIKAVAPAAATGAISITLGSQTVTGPVFTYVSDIFIKPYASGDVTLTTQAEVDAFTALNKGRQLQISGSLTIGNIGPNPTATDINAVATLSNITSVSGSIEFENNPELTDAPFLNTITAAGNIYVYQSAFTSLSFNSLSSFNGNFALGGLTRLNNVSFSSLTSVKALSITSCPVLTDLSFLNNLTSATAIYFSFMAATSVSMDKLQTLGRLTITWSANLSSLSAKSLTGVLAVFTIYNCPKLSTMDFTGLTSISDKLSLYGTSLTDLSGFSALQTLGSLTVYHNSLLINFHGLEHVTTLSAPAIGPGRDANLMTRLGGIYIVDNTSLASLTGLQNIATIPIAYIGANHALSDLCPLKASINALNSMSAYSYIAQNLQIDETNTYSIPALTLTNNGSFATTQDAVTAVAACK